MARRQQLEAPVLRQLRRHRPGDLRQARLGLQDVEFGRHLLGPGQNVLPQPERVGQRQQDALHFFGFLDLELDDLVVDLDGRQRFQIQRLAAGRTAMDQSGQRRPVLGLHQQHEPPVALGDDLVLQVLRGVLAAQIRVERLTELRALASKPVANRSQRRTGVIDHVARGRDGVPHRSDFVLERRRATHKPLQTRQLARRPAHGRRAGFHRLEVVRQGQQAQRFKRATLDAEQTQERLEILGRPQREHRVGRQVTDGLRRGGQRFAHSGRIGGRRERLEAGGSCRRERETAHGGDNTVEFEGPQAACGHFGTGGVESGGNR